MLSSTMIFKIYYLVLADTDSGYTKPLVNGVDIQRNEQTGTNSKRDGKLRTATIASQHVQFLQIEKEE